MATSSILANFVISDSTVAEKFVSALENSATSHNQTSSDSNYRKLTDKEAIKALMTKNGTGRK